MIKMQMSAVGAAVLRSREGDKLVAYKDSVGVWTIGTGITTASGLIKVVPGLVITQAQSDALYAKAVQQYAAPVRTALNVAVPQHTFDALVSLCFNIGAGAFARSTVVKRINAGDLAGGIEAILMWNKPSEIIPRRQGEYDQARTPYAVSLPKARRSDARPIRAPAGTSVLDPTPSQPVGNVVKPSGPGGLFGPLISAIQRMFS